MPCAMLTCRVCVSCRLPQYVYPSPYVASTPGMTIPVSPHSPLSPTTAGQFALDYPAGYGGGQFPNGYEAAYPYTTAAQYMTAAQTPYSYAAVAPQPLGHFAAYQPQQIQERMQ